MWSQPEYVITSVHAVSLTVTTLGEAPTPDELQTVQSQLDSWADLISAAAPLILENYDYAHFKALGVDESLLVAETPEAIAAAARLESVWFNDASGESFELSFTVPWDDHHSFDVEFAGGVPICCSVNG